MAADVPIETDVIEIRKNATETIRIQRTTFNGIRLVDARVYVARANGDVPTKKGLALRPELWRELLPLIEQALAEADDEKS